MKLKILIMIPILGAALSAVPSLLSSVGNTIGGIFSSNHQYSKDMAMYNAQNAYNTPAEQMKRLTAAGLNPNLVYGQGAAGASGNTVVSPPKYQAPSFNMQLPDVISRYQELRRQNVDIDVAGQQLQNLQDTSQNIQANTAKTVADTDLVKLNAVTEGLRQAGMMTANAKSQLDYEVASELKSVSLATAKQSLENLKYQGNVLQSTAALNRANKGLVDINSAIRGIEKGQYQLGINGGGTLSQAARFIYQNKDKFGRVVKSYSTPLKAIPAPDGSLIVPKPKSFRF